MCLRNSAPSLKSGSGTIAARAKGLGTLCSNLILGEALNHSSLTKTETTLTQYKEKKKASLNHRVGRHDGQHAGKRKEADVLQLTSVLMNVQSAFGCAPIFGEYAKRISLVAVSTDVELINTHDFDITASKCRRKPNDKVIDVEFAR